MITDPLIAVNFFFRFFYTITLVCRNVTDSTCSVTMYQAGAANKATDKTESQNLHLTVSTLQKLSFSHCSVPTSILPSLFSKSNSHCAFKSLNPTLKN